MTFGSKQYLQFENLPISTFKFNFKATYFLILKSKHYWAKELGIAKMMTKSWSFVLPFFRSPSPIIESNIPPWNSWVKGG